ncbi:MAG: hypothetical protein M1835_000657 [Candelina submexicana]|nr:MAG: hypothetical protein M1835_000657 [Candelina submexicana]
MFSGLSPRYLNVLYHSSLNKASYGTLLGTQFFQSFVGGIVAYKALPRPQFASLQQAIFPIYFSIQTALPVVLALTYPGERSPPRSTRSGLAGVLDAKTRWQVLVPILTILSTSLANLAVIGPATTKIMRERKHQGSSGLRFRFLTVALWLTLRKQRRVTAKRATIVRHIPER